MKVLENYLTIKETERLLIRPLSINDVDIWKNFVSDKNAIKYFPFIKPENPQLEAEVWIQKQLDRYKENRFGLMALIEKSSGNLVGQSGLLRQNIDDKNEVEIGYSLLPDYWRKGFAIEAVRTFKQLAFEKNFCDSLISIIHIENIPSQKVALKNGMSKDVQMTYHDLPVFIYRTMRSQC